MRELCVRELCVRDLCVRDLCVRESCVCERVVCVECLNRSKILQIHHINYMNIIDFNAGGHRGPRGVGDQ